MFVFISYKYRFRVIRNITVMCRVHPPQAHANKACHVSTMSNTARGRRTRHTAAIQVIYEHTARTRHHIALYSAIQTTSPHRWGGSMQKVARVIYEARSLRNI